MNRRVIRLLRVALVVLLLGSVLGQVLVPVFASEVADTHPGIESLIVPYSLAGILVIACGQVALLVVWRLLSLVSGGVIFTRRSLRLVDVITICGAVATVLVTVVLAHQLAVVNAGGVTALLGLPATIAGGVAFVLLMIVMRGLLEAAIADRAELDEVIGWPSSSSSTSGSPDARCPWATSPRPSASPRRTSRSSSTGAPEPSGSPLSTRYAACSIASRARYPRWTRRARPVSPRPS